MGQLWHPFFLLLCNGTGPSQMMDNGALRSISPDPFEPWPRTTFMPNCMRSNMSEEQDPELTPWSSKQHRNEDRLQRFFFLLWTCSAMGSLTQQRSHTAGMSPLNGIDVSFSFH
ncbi:hypothetical protein LY76DRAFT_184976 [Colletotrichum caudatum]|nr:hypothetical protein LY76DRAFT_184976 [Colletotrichum caudatum]